MGLMSCNLNSGKWEKEVSEKREKEKEGRNKRREKKRRSKEFDVDQTIKL